MSLDQLLQLLPLPREELQQVIDYAATLSKPEAASHFSNLLGDSPRALEFISSFNARHDNPAAVPPSATVSHVSTAGRSQPTNRENDGVPKGKRHTKKPKQDIHVLPARKIDDYAQPSGSMYQKKSQQELNYIPTPTPKNTNTGTKVTITGGTAMTGASSALADLDSAIRSLEISTNPSLSDDKARRCNCVATRHPLQSATPNCLSCGKVICMKEGLGPCTFCGTPLLSSSEVQAMVRELRDERGRERMAAEAEAHRRAPANRANVTYAKTRTAGPGDFDSPSLSDAEAKARTHRDKLLGFQAQNTKRTTVHDEAADFDASGALHGTGSMWATPEERARELKRQQKLLREMEWNAKPEYEKRRQVASIDIVKGKVLRKMVTVERPLTPPEDDVEIAEEEATNGLAGGVLVETSGNGSSTRTVGGGAFSGNPLLGSLIKPIYRADDAKGKGRAPEGRPGKPQKGWRRVQDDLDDNEDVILDGGIHGYGGQQGDEPDCG